MMNLKDICIMVQLNNDNKMLNTELLIDMISFYTNILNKNDKIELLKAVYRIKDNEKFLKDIDTFKTVEINKNSLNEILHILEVNL